MADLWFSRHPVPHQITGGFGETGGAYPASGHRGVDYGCPTGTPVYAPAAGVVVSPYNDGSFGIAVCIDHPGTPWYTLYAHLSQANVSVGAQVADGQLLGYSGMTGYVTGPHLHWQCCDTYTFPPDISHSTDPVPMIRTTPPPDGGDDMTEAEVRAIVNEMLQPVYAKITYLEAAIGGMQVDVARLNEILVKRFDIQEAAVGPANVVDAAWQALLEAGLIRPGDT